MDIETIINEFNFKATKSSGPGGQHVNKTSSKVLVSFHIQNSKGLNGDEKELLGIKLRKKISSGGYISISSSNSRSQHQNKISVIDRLIELSKKENHLKKNKQKIT
jgi:ribosome-associated protein